MKNKQPIFMILGFFIIQLLTAQLLLFTTEITVLTVNFVLLTGWGLFLYQETLKNKWKELFQFTSLSSVIKLSIILYFANVIIRIFLISTLENYIDMDTLGQNQQSLEELLEQIPLLLFVALTVIQAPLCEELVFREAFNGWINPNQKLLRYTFWLFSTFLFAALHVYTLQDFIIYLPLSFSLLYMYVKYDNNIWGSIIFHFLNNFISVLLMLLLNLSSNDVTLQWLSRFIP